MATKTRDIEAIAPALPDADALYLQFMRYYAREAWLLDERKFHDWLDLFSDDIHYYMPRRKNVRFKELHREFQAEDDLAAIFEEDKILLRIRVERFDTGTAWAEDPPSRTRHLITNLEVEPLENGEVQAKTAFLIYRSHLETEVSLYAGGRTDTLRNIDGQWKIAKRVIYLDANVILAKNLSVFF